MNPTTSAEIVAVTKLDIWANNRHIPPLAKKNHSMGSYGAGGTKIDLRAHVDSHGNAVLFNID
jgi:hypothetical protein